MELPSRCSLPETPREGASAAAAVALAEPGASNDENAALALNATGSATVERSHTSCQSYRFPDPWVPSADHEGQD
jgi:hypothetical protein